ACYGGSNHENRGSGGAGGTGGSGGKAGSGGRAGTAGRAGTGGGTTRPPIPDTPDDSCARFALEFDGSSCTSSCDSVSCDCNPFPQSFISCNFDLGCLTAVDCRVSCDADVGDIIDCASDYRPCT